MLLTQRRVVTQHSRKLARAHAVAFSRRQHVRAAAAAAASGPSVKDLQAQLAQKEAQLAAMFESGQPMPKAADVARLRSEVTALADQLAGRPVQPLTMGGHDAAMGAVAVKSAHVRARSKTEELAFKAYELVEEQLRSNQGMGNSEDMEVARLEAENIQLRAQAYDLLKRQQQLETLLAEVRGDKPPEQLLSTAEGLLARMKIKLQRT